MILVSPSPSSDRISFHLTQAGWTTLTYNQIQNILTQDDELAKIEKMEQIRSLYPFSPILEVFNPTKVNVQVIWQNIIEAIQKQPTYSIDDNVFVGHSGLLALMLYTPYIINQLPSNIQYLEVQPNLYDMVSSAISIGVKPSEAVLRYLYMQGIPNAITQSSQDFWNSSTSYLTQFNVDMDWNYERNTYQKLWEYEAWKKRCLISPLTDEMKKIIDEEVQNIRKIYGNKLP